MKRENQKKKGFISNANSPLKRDSVVFIQTENLKERLIHAEIDLGKLTLRRV
jgi:hypothetical protein